MRLTIQSESTGTGWRRLIESLKLQIIFHKRATKYRALLLKMTYKDKGSYESSPPCPAGLQAEAPQAKITFLPCWLYSQIKISGTCHLHDMCTCANDMQTTCVWYKISATCHLHALQLVWARLARRMYTGLQKSFYIPAKQPYIST